MDEVEVEMRYSDAEAQYRFIANPRKASGDIWFYADNDQDVEFICSQDRSKVWTVYDDMSLISGCWRINRLGYLISENPVPAGTCIYTTFGEN